MLSWSIFAETSRVYLLCPSQSACVVDWSHMTLRNVLSAVKVNVRCTVH